MGGIDRFLDVFRAVNPLRGRGSAATQPDRERGQHMRGQPFTQTVEEQEGTRQRMEAELDAQRERRAQESTA
jgi:hypothetical protein